MKPRRKIFLSLPKKLKQKSRDVTHDFTRMIRQIPQVAKCYNISGEYDHLLKIRARNMKQYLLCLLFVLEAALPGRCDGIDSWFAGLDTTAFLLVDKQKQTLTLVAPGGRIERDYRIACGENYGNKTKKGDHRTPEGRFPINQLLNAAGLSHDFKDGKGPIANAYGPWFFRLDVPGFITIGIHGTHLPESIGSRSTEGCIRLSNKDIIDLKERVAVGMPVVILPDTLSQPVDALLAILAGSEPAGVAAATSNGPNWALAVLATVAGIAAGVAAVRIFNKKRHANL